MPRRVIEAFEREYTSNLVCFAARFDTRLLLDNFITAHLLQLKEIAVLQSFAKKGKEFLKGYFGEFWILLC